MTPGPRGLLAITQLVQVQDFIPNKTLVASANSGIKPNTLMGSEGVRDVGVHERPPPILHETETISALNAFQLLRSCFALGAARGSPAGQAGRVDPLVSHHREP